MATIHLTPLQKPSHSSLPLRISSPLDLAGSKSYSHKNHNDGDDTSLERWIPGFQAPPSPSSSIPVPVSARALVIPEIILLIQGQLDRSSLLTSLRVATLWHQTGHHLVWQTVDWDNTNTTNINAAAGTTTTTAAATIEEKMLENSHRIRTLRCMFHSQAGTSYIDSSVLLRTLLEGERQPRTRKLQTLSLRGHFSLQSIGSRVGAATGSSIETAVSPLLPRYIPFRIPTLVHLDIKPSVNSAVDLHLILDTAVRLRSLVIDSHGPFVDSNNNMANTLQPATQQSPPSVQPSEIIPHQQYEYPVHSALMSLKIQHLKMSRPELESVVARCPNLVEFQSVCSPATLWKPLPASQQQQQQPHPPPAQQHQQQHQQQDMDSHVAQILAPQQPRSLVSALAKSCPRIQRFHVGLQQGGFHTDLVQDALTSFPRLVSLGLPTTDCTKATMDVIKSNQLRHHSSLSSSSMSLSSFSLLSEGARVAPRTTSSAFLTSLTILNVSSSEKVSQALHEFLCWTPYLKEFYAYNTTLYLEHMQPARGGGIGGGGDVVVEVQGSSTAVVAASVASSTLSNAQDQYSSRRGNSSGARAPVAVVDHSEGYVRVEQAHLDSGSDSETESSSPPAHVAHAAHAAVTVSRSTMTIVDQSNNLAPPTLSSSTPTPTPVPVANPIAGGAQMRQWACTGLETLVVRFAHLPWRTNSEPPKRSKDTFAFLAPCQNLKRLCIKEGLMLDAGREYDTLARLKALEEVVFTTCYPIPIKPSDMEWVMAVSYKSTTENDGSSSEALKRVVVRRQKANAVLDKEMHRWFDEYGCGVQLYLQLTDCCEEEYRFF